METHSALSVILCPRKLPKCVYELSIPSQAHEIGNNASALASLNIWDTWNHYLILLAVSKETKQKYMFGSGFHFAEDWNIQSLPRRKSHLIFLWSRRTHSFGPGLTAMGDGESAIHIFSTFILSPVHSNPWCRSLCEFH